MKIQKAIEIKTTFKKSFGTSIDDIPELNQFVKDINEWIRNNHYTSGRIYLECYHKYIIYQLHTLENTVVKVSNKFTL